MKKLYIFKTEHCICCGKEIPEGSQVCFDCLEQFNSEERILTEDILLSEHTK